MVLSHKERTERLGDEVSASFRRDRHAADEDWLDYAREVGDPARRAELASHLEAGCRRCADTLRLWLSAVEVAGRDRAYDPPDALLRQVKGAFSLQRPDHRRSLAASLVFDSFLQPLAAGVRSSAPGPRQLLYKAGRYAVRLRAEEAATGRLSLVGQVVDEERPGSFLPQVTVLVFAGKEAIDQTLTNRLGEFAFDAAPAEDLQLAIGLAENGFLTVALPVARSDRGAEAPPPRTKRMNWK
jgi:hypothetical protein